MSDFDLHCAVTAAGDKFNEDAYGLWPSEAAPMPCSVRAAWVLDGVTGINDRALLPGPTDAAWFVGQVQEALPALLTADPDAPIDRLMTRLVDALAARQNAAWLSPSGAAGFETPAASLTLFRQLGDAIEIARLGDCSVLLERADGEILLLDDPVLSAIEADLSAGIVGLQARGVADPAAIRREMMPALRDIRRRRNAGGGYGVLAADRACLDLLKVDRFAGDAWRTILLASDGYYRLVNVYRATTDADLVRRTSELGAAALLAALRAIEAADTQGVTYPRLKMADDATALLLRRADAGIGHRR